MIAFLRGRLHHAGPDYAVVDVNGVGYQAFISAATRSRLPAAGREVVLHTSMQVREDSITLYGFLDAGELELFHALLNVTGIGPKVALGILSAATPEEFRRAIAFEDVAYLTRLPNIGKKTAQRLVLELRDRLGAATAAPEAQPGVAAPAAAPAADPAALAWAEALEALVSLGYSRLEAGQALEAVRPRAPEGAPAAECVRLALRWLGARKAM